MCSDIRIQSERHTCHLSFGGCQFIDNLQFWNTLHVETENIMLKTKVDLPVTLTNAGINDLVTGESCLDGGFYLTATHAVGSQPSFTDDAEDLGISISLHGIMYHESVVFARLTHNRLKCLAQ